MQGKSIHPENAISAQKAKLRVEAAARRKQISLKSGAQAAQAIAERGAPFIEALNVPHEAGGYHALRHELDPAPLLNCLHGKRFRIGLPRTGEGALLSFREWRPGDPLERGKLGVFEPSRMQPAMQPAIVLVPVVAFDRMGNRLGYGAGWYDACLRDLRGGRRVIAIGIAFDEQEFPEVPREPQDEPLDTVLTPSGIIACRT